MFQGLNYLNRGRRLLLYFLVLCVLFFIVYYAQRKPRTPFSSQRPLSPPKPFSRYECYMETDSENWNEGPKRLEDVLLSDTLPPPGRSIFFHETRCRSPYSQYILNLTARQACSIESAALHNPNFQVFVLFASSTYLSDVQKNPLYDALKSYKNVHFRQLNIKRYAKDTPIEDWLEKRDLFRSKYTLFLN